MKKQNSKNIGKKIFLAAAGAVLTAVGFIVIPPLIRKYSDKAYKASLKREFLNIDNMGPKIVPHKLTEE